VIISVKCFRRIQECWKQWGILAYIIRHNLFKYTSVPCCSLKPKWLSIYCVQASSQVSRFAGQNTFLGGQGFCFYMFKTIFLDTTTFGGTKKLGALSLNSPVVTGLVVAKNGEMQVKQLGDDSCKRNRSIVHSITYVPILVFANRYNGRIPILVFIQWEDPHSCFYK